jgi:hypothetical protein
MAVNGKAKGNRGELDCTKILDERFGKGKFKRVPMSGAFTGGMNRFKTENISEEAKGILSGDIMTPKEFKFSIEHKNYSKLEFWDLFNSSSDLFKWMEQCEGDAEFAKKYPMLIVKINHHKRIVFIKIDVGNYFFECRRWYCYNLEDLLKLEDDFFLEKIN